MVIAPLSFIYTKIYPIGDVTEYDIILLFATYLILSIATNFYSKKIASKIIGRTGGKKIYQIGSEFFMTTVISDFDYSHSTKNLLEILICDILGYSLTNITKMPVNGVPCDMWHYSIKSPDGWHTWNILLIELAIGCDPIDVEEGEAIADYEIVDPDKTLCEGYEHSFIHIYQFIDDGDSISQISAGDTKLDLLINAMVPQSTLVHQWIKYDITPYEIQHLLSDIFYKYLISEYGSIFNKIKTKIASSKIGSIIEKHKGTFKHMSYIVVLVVIAFEIINSIHIDQNTSTSIQIILALIAATPGIYFIIKKEEK